MAQRTAGCTNSAGKNYLPIATDDDDSCDIPIYGCTIPRALNFDSTATVLQARLERMTGDLSLSVATGREAIAHSLLLLCVRGHSRLDPATEAGPFCSICGTCTCPMRQGCIPRKRGCTDSISPDYCKTANTHVDLYATRPPRHTHSARRSVCTVVFHA